MHDDHVCGLTANGQRVFPNATVYAAEAEAAFWLGDGPADAKHRRKERVVAALAPYRAAGAFKTFKPGAMLLAGVRTIDAYGHTPGHTAYQFDSGGRSIVFIGDLVHAEAVQFPHPEVTMEFDVVPSEAIAARRALFAQAADRHWLIAGAHLPFPGIGYVRRYGTAFAYVPIAKTR
jgi:glyoxylase-like metal-dependent hydrolase (beta-lactamase superfamily II)